ncbi:hypothetical protein ANN_21388 [Periplaneta americana]|uniref:Uncharacterized protein n=1 Tax=Periplaneta americana TaxID=6978 RepID=A0ABQ8SH12_PERAM|nr:hypothetical protein ANN_21388 [Periplaneta americana]
MTDSTELNGAQNSSDCSEHEMFPIIQMTTFSLQDQCVIIRFLHFSGVTPINIYRQLNETCGGLVMDITAALAPLAQPCLTKHGSTSVVMRTLKNNRYWDSENPHLFHEQQRHDINSSHFEERTATSCWTCHQEMCSLPDITRNLPMKDQGRQQIVGLTSAWITRGERSFNQNESNVSARRSPPSFYN